MVEHREHARELIRQSLRVGAPGLAEPAREAIVRSIMLKLEGKGLLLASDRPRASAPNEALLGALVHFFKQFRQSVFAEYHGTGAEPYRERGFSTNCWFDAESARLLAALDQPTSSASPENPCVRLSRQRLEEIEVAWDRKGIKPDDGGMSFLLRMSRIALDQPPASSGKALTGKGA